MFCSFTEPFTVPPTSIPENTVLATLTYRILPGGAPGVAALRNENQVFGLPPLLNVYTTEGLSIHPSLGSGSITVLGGEVDCDANATLSVGSASAESGEVTVELYGSSACEVTGFALAIGHDSTRVEFVSATPGVFLVSHAGSELFFLVEERNSNGFMSIFAFFDLTQPFTSSTPPH